MESPPGSNAGSAAGPGPGAAAPTPQLAVLDFFFPGFSGVSSVIFKHLGVDLNLYVPLLVLFASLTFAWDYIRDYFWGMVSKYFMSTVEIRIDDEIYDMIMTWVATQKFAQSSRCFVVNTTLSSKTRHAWRYYDDDSDSDEDDEVAPEHKDKALSYTPAFGTHNFWYKGRLLQFRRTLSKEQANYNVTESEEVSISCYGRNPWVLKELLLEARAQYMKKDNNNTLIYRGTCVGLRAEPTWRRCLARASRPLSTVILSEAKKKTLVEDLSDYLAPATRRWYSNRGIPYRRGYLLYGPPGTGKSSLSLALAGHFGMRIYIVSLNSISSSEENLSNLFAELPRRCVVLLEDIDTAGLTNTRETSTPANPTENGDVSKSNQPDKPANPDTFGRLSLSGLLNILDGVASQEGRVLIMTTNHLDKLDSALIRPGRVDMTIEFGRADGDIAASIFTAIYTKLEGEEADEEADEDGSESGVERLEAKRGTEQDEVEALALQFAAKIPADAFSPAEVQGYLLRHKRSARDAVRNVDSWVAELRKKKEKGSAPSEQGTIAERKEEPKAEQKGLGQERAGEIDKDAEEGRASCADQIRLDGRPAEASPSALEAGNGPLPGRAGPGSDTSSSLDSAVPEPRTPADIGPVNPTSETGGEVKSEGIAIGI